MEIIWYISDGGDYWEQHEQVTTVPDSKLEKCKSQEDRRVLIERYIQRDFRKIVGWCVPDEAESKKIYG